MKFKPRLLLQIPELLPHLLLQNREVLRQPGSRGSHGALYGPGAHPLPRTPNPPPRPHAPKQTQPARPQPGRAALGRRINA